MKEFISGNHPEYELTYSDVFILPGHETKLKSRMDVDMSIPCELPLTTPVIVANMSAVAGPRMAETTARRGAMTMLVQSRDLEATLEEVAEVKAAHPFYETPVVADHITGDTILEHLSYLTPHGIVFISGNNGWYKAVKAVQGTRGVTIQDVKVTAINLNDAAPENAENIFQLMDYENSEAAVVLDAQDNAVGVLTRESLVRSQLHKPALDEEGRLVVGVALGINENITERTKAYSEAGVDAILIDTANGHQERMLDAIKAARKAAPGMFIIAGTVVTAEGTKALINAGANMVKVGIGAGAMCITRMRTGVGRPQFSAVLDCSTAAKEVGGTVLADGGIKHPRDVALAMAAGAGATMIGSWFAPTYESAGKVVLGDDGFKYVEHYGMASTRAVNERQTDGAISTMAHMRKQFFEEGASDVRMRLKPGSESAEAIIDQIVSGVRSTCSYVGVEALTDLSTESVIGIQSPAAFGESNAVSGTW